MSLFHYKLKTEDSRRWQVDRYVGDTLSPLCAALQLPDNQPKNLTGFTVTFKMVAENDGRVVVDYVPAVVTDAVAGTVEYKFTLTDVATPGTYYGWFRVSDGKEYDTYGAGRMLRIQLLSRG